MEMCRRPSKLKPKDWLSEAVEIQSRREQSRCNTTGRVPVGMCLPRMESAYGGGG